MLKANSERFDESREARRLKDRSLMLPFYQKLKQSKLSSSEKYYLGYVIEQLAAGLVLVVPEAAYPTLCAQLRDLSVPEKVIENLLVSKNLPAYGK